MNGRGDVGFEDAFGFGALNQLVELLEFSSRRFALACAGIGRRVVLCAGRGRLSNGGRARGRPERVARPPDTGSKLRRYRLITLDRFLVDGCDEPVEAAGAQSLPAMCT